MEQVLEPTEREAALSWPATERRVRPAAGTLPALSIVAPTYNERANVAPLIAAVTAVLDGTAWELIFVDDDSPDGTCEAVADAARAGAPVRCIRRVGRRGLSSAVVEGVMSARGEIVCVMDADLQHDETILPRMLEILTTTDAEIVVASRHVDGGGMGEWSAVRRRMSAFATLASKLLVGEITDPMSGFFMTRRSVFDAVVYDLSQQGYKILLDLLASAPTPLKVAEVPYVFRTRQAGESKIDAMIVLEYAFLLIEKLTRGWIPPKFVLFATVGVAGLGVHLLALKGLKIAGLEFLPAQGAATLAAMTFNFWLNNAVTYRNDRLKGAQFLIGYGLFCVVCSLGAVANISVADLTMAKVHSWSLAGIAGAVMSAVFNFSVATRVVWGRRRRRPIRA